MMLRSFVFLLGYRCGEAFAICGVDGVGLPWPRCQGCGEGARCVTLARCWVQWMVIPEQSRDGSISMRNVRNPACPLRYLSPRVGFLTL